MSFKDSPEIQKFEEACFTEWLGMPVVEAPTAKAAIDACLAEITRLEDFIEKLGEFTATCVTAGAEYLAEAEKWNWISKQYELFVQAHSWIPTNEELVEKY